MGNTHKACLKLGLVVLIILTGASLAQTVELQDGCLVPYAYYNSTVDTAIGLITVNNVLGYSFYWNFMSADGLELGSGAIPYTFGVYKYPFSLRSGDGNSHPDQVGYVIFTFDDDGTLETTEDRATMSASAVLLSVDDAAFIPVIPLDRSDYDNSNINLTSLTTDPIVALSYGQGVNKYVRTNYWVERSFGAYTHVVIWASQTPPASLFASSYPIGGTGTSVGLTPTHTVLNVYDIPSDASGMPESHVDGILAIWPGGGERFIFSLIGSTSFSAMQTMIGFTPP